MQMSLTCSANNIHKNDLKCVSSKRKAFTQIHTIAYIHIYIYTRVARMYAFIKYQPFDITIDM